MHIALGNVLAARSDFGGAAASYRNALSVQSGHCEARIRLAHVLKLNTEYGAAADVLHALAADYPANAAVLREFGRLYFAQQRYDEARASFAQVLQLSQDDADVHHWLANIESVLGNPRLAAVHFARSLALKPLLRVPAKKSTPDFSALFLFSPGDANTPPQTLVKMADYESCFLLLLPDAVYDVERLRKAAQVVVNLVSDCDQGSAILPIAEALVERIGLPVVNQPQSVLKTDRKSVALRLAGIPFCRVPRVERVTANDTACSPIWNWRFPLLVRMAGTHGGETFEKVDTAAALQMYFAAHSDGSSYLTEYVDYRSADGLFRKYRFFFVGADILPYHLAIGDAWKIHHQTTDMADHPWMQREEAAFLDNPASIFGPQQRAALQAIRAAIGLEFCGIDCALGADGVLVVFEVNASMLVHENYGPFIYKAPAVDRIKRAFDAMLRGIALHPNASKPTPSREPIGG